MAPVVDNNQFELPMLLETPSKKRKRNAETNPFLSFSDQTFSIPSSTPIHNKQIDGSAFENPSFRFGVNNNGSNKENINIFSDSCMEVKSIAELAAENPFEVIRKPPNKKKRKLSEIEDSCFINPALNLDAVEKPSVNPFEVVRQEDNTGKQDNESCFVNGGLNIKGKDTGEAVNPFEIARPTEMREAGEGENKEAGECKGIENPALEIQTYALAVPFTPSINHRINFQELPADALTPCQLLTKNLVFTPEPNSDCLLTPKKTVTISERKPLSIISEEPVDIGEELDCYQLELENSINEAKALKQKSVRGSTGKRTKSRRSLIDIKHISNLSMKLKQLEESEGEEEDNKPAEANIPNQENTTEPAIEEPSTPPTPQPQMTTFTVTKEVTVKQEIRIDVSNPDVQFEEVDDFEDEEQDVDLFANPAPFQRAYRKKEDPIPEDQFKQPALPESTPTTKTNKVKNAIRKSFRKLIHTKQHLEAQVQITDLDEKPKSEEPHHGFMSSIRYSLRRKAHKTKETPQTGDAAEAEKDLEMSIIAEAPRTVFRQPNTDEYRNIAAGGSMDKVGSTLRSSLRRSTKDMKRQMMKNVFKKAGEEKID